MYATLIIAIQSGFIRQRKYYVGRQCTNARRMLRSEARQSYRLDEL